VFFGQRRLDQIDFYRVSLLAEGPLNAFNANAAKLSHAKRLTQEEKNEVGR
jgi:hypothetical protein